MRSAFRPRPPKNSVAARRAYRQVAREPKASEDQLARGCMNSSAGGTDADRRCPRLAPDWEEHAGELSPAEGFLLSRIDGHTPWTVLREIGGLSPADADAALSAWAAAGIVLLDPDKPGPPAARDAAASAPDAPTQRQVDPSLD